MKFIILIVYFLNPNCFKKSIVLISYTISKIIPKINIKENEKVKHERKRNRKVK